MTDSELKPERGHSLAQVEKLVEERVARARKEELLDIYEELLMTIWNRIFPTLGRVTVVAILERALLITANKYPQLHHLKVRNEGLDFSELREHADQSARELLREAFVELVSSLVDILAMLTGDILVQQLVREIEGRSKQ